MPVASWGFILPRDVQAEHGFQTGIVGAQPAAGAAFNRVVPGAFFEVIVSVRATLVTSATAANRLPTLQAKDGDGNVLHAVPALSFVTASLTATVRWSLALTSAYQVDNTSQNLPLFPFVMPSGWSIQVNGGNMQAGDQFTSIGLVVQQYATGMELERIVLPGPVDLSSIGLVSGTPPPLPSVAGPMIAPSPSPSAPSPPAAPAPAAAPAPVSADLGPGSSAGSGPGVSRL